VRDSFNFCGDVTSMLAGGLGRITARNGACNLNPDPHISGPSETAQSAPGGPAGRPSVPLLAPCNFPYFPTSAPNLKSMHRRCMQPPPSVKRFASSSPSKSLG
jgi:hypothetical protein